MPLQNTSNREVIPAGNIILAESQNEKTDKPFTSYTIELAKSCLDQSHDSTHVTIDDEIRLCYRAFTSRPNMFEQYCIAYPDYMHGPEQFVRACSYLAYLLRGNSYIIHQSLWDDWIRFYTGPFTQHVRNCASQNTPTIDSMAAYHIQVTIPCYTRNIIVWNTLDRAMRVLPTVSLEIKARLSALSKEFYNHEKCQMSAKVAATYSTQKGNNQNK